MTSTVQKLWAETFRYAQQHSPFYRELLGSFATVPRIEDVPTTDKRMASERNADFLCVQDEKVVEIVTTSGTTGAPLVWKLTENDLRRLGVNEKISFDCAGLKSRDTVLVATAMDRCFIAGLAYTLGLRELGCAIVRVGPSSPLLVLDTIRRLKPTAIVAVPSFLRLIAAKARETEFDLRGAGVTRCICIGEPIRDCAFELNVSGRVIESEWNAKVFSTYGVTELANSLCECEAGRGGHLHDDQLYIEILDDAGNLVPDGTVGEITATTFGVEAMPVIRYRTGDCAAAYREPCSCGRTTLRLGPVVGRKNQRLKFKGTTIFPSAIQAVLESTLGVDSFVIVASAADSLSDSIEVLISGGATDAGVRELIQSRTKITPFVRHAPAAEIEALQLPPDARKRRTFVDLR